MKKKITVKVLHDSLTLTARYETGGSFKFRIGRSGETLDWGGSSDKATAKKEMAAFLSCASCVAGETNADRIERLRVLAEAANSIGGLVASLKV